MHKIPLYTRTQAVFSQSHPRLGITNCAANWRPAVVDSNKVDGHALMYLSLANTVNNYELRLGMMYHPRNRLTLSLWYGSSNQKAMAMPTPITIGESAYFEIDVNPLTSQVTFWVNEQGMDMGVLRGFKGGAQRASWVAVAGPNDHLPNGSFTDCAIAHAEGWESCKFLKSDAAQLILQPHHKVELIAADAIAYAEMRSMA